LVRLHLPADLLKVDELANVRMREDMVTPARPPKLEAEGLDEPAHVRKRDVRKIAAGDPCQESPRIHDVTLPANTDSPEQASDSCQAHRVAPSARA